MSSTGATIGSRDSFRGAAGKWVIILEERGSPKLCRGNGACPKRTCKGQMVRRAEEHR